MIDGSRRTGRSTRMLQEACCVAVNGNQQVVVVAASLNELKGLRDLYRKHCGMGERFIIWTTLNEFDKVTRGLRTDIVVFKDHHAVEVEVKYGNFDVSRWKRQATKLRKYINSICTCYGSGSYSIDAFGTVSSSYTFNKCERCKAIEEFDKLTKEQ